MTPTSSWRTRRSVASKPSKLTDAVVHRYLGGDSVRARAVDRRARRIVQPVSDASATLTLTLVGNQIENTTSTANSSYSAVSVADAAPLVRVASSVSVHDGASHPNAAPASRRAARRRRDVDASSAVSSRPYTTVGV